MAAQPRRVAADAAAAAVERLALKLATLLRPAYVAIGSNLDAPREQVLEAVDRLSALSATSPRRSRLYATRPMGLQDQPDFVNAVAGILTSYSARDLMHRLLDIENSMGRVRQRHWGPRIIDLDLIWMVNSPVDEPSLRLPHPGVSSRNFVLYPLADVAPTLEIPGFGSVHVLLQAVDAAGIRVLE